jgi:hypothetical protein
MMPQQHTTSLKLPFEFNEQKLVAELDLLSKSKWIPHFNKGGYTGKWNSIALYALNGDETNIFALNNDANSTIEETKIIKECHYLREVIDTFKCPLRSVRLLKLGVDACIKPHRDFELGYENSCFRIHIPITTNRDVGFILDGETLEMKPGECWYINVNRVHSASNNGKTDRVHLVIDGQRNDWSDDIFFSLASKESLLETKHEEREPDPEAIRSIIRELERIRSPGAEQTIKTLRKQLTDLSV